MKPTILVAVLAAAGLTSGLALAQDKAACVQAAADGQVARNAHRLVQARDAFRACAALTCPAVVQTQCVSWLSDVDKSLPSVVVTAKDRTGGDLFDVKVSVDGAPLTSRLDGGALPLDPGPHTFHFALADGTALDQQVLVVEGQKDQRVSVVLEPAAPAPTPPVPPPPVAQPPSTPPAAEATSHGLGGMRTGALILGGAGVVGVGLGSYFGLQAMSKRNASNADCPGGSSGYCSNDGVSLSKNAVSAGNASTVAFAVGLTALAGGVVLWLVAPKDVLAAASVHLGAGMSASSPSVTLGGRF